MKDLLTGEHMLFTELQNFAAFKSYSILKLGKLVGFLIKKDTKIEIGCFMYFWTTFAFGVQSSWTLEHSFYT